MDNEPLKIKCEDHDTETAAVVCGHLVKNNNVPLGFIENSDDPDDLQAWCFACEYVFQQEQELSERFKSFAETVLVCTTCYKEIKEKHHVAP